MSSHHREGMLTCNAEVISETPLKSSRLRVATDLWSCWRVSLVTEDSVGPFGQQSVSKTYKEVVQAAYLFGCVQVVEEAVDETLWVDGLSVKTRWSYWSCMGCDFRLHTCIECEERHSDLSEA